MKLPTPHSPPPAVLHYLEESSSGHVDDGGLVLAVGVLGPGLLGHEGPELVQVDCGAAVDGQVGVFVEVPHADLTEVSGVVLVEVDPVVVLSSGVSATSGMLPVLADTTVAVTHVATQLSGLFLAGRHLLKCYTQANSLVV